MGSEQIKSKRRSSRVDRQFKSGRGGLRAGHATSEAGSVEGHLSPTPVAAQRMGMMESREKGRVIKRQGHHQCSSSFWASAALQHCNTCGTSRCQRVRHKLCTCCSPAAFLLRSASLEPESPPAVEQHPSIG